MNEQDMANLVKRIFYELRRVGTWLTYRQLAYRILRNPDNDFLVEAACLNRKDLFAAHQEKRVKLGQEEYYRNDFDPFAPQMGELDKTVPRFNEFWVYVSDWDVSLPGRGPYRSVVHRHTCTHVEGRKYKEEGSGMKNYWRSFPNQNAAVKFADSVHPWQYCSICFTAP